MQNNIYIFNKDFLKNNPEHFCNKCLKNSENVFCFSLRKVFLDSIQNFPCFIDRETESNIFIPFAFSDN